MDKLKLKEFRDGIFALRTRRFGTVAEIMIKKLYHLDESGTLEFDKYSSNTNERIEVKFSTVMKENDDKIKEDNIIDQIIKANIGNRAMKSTDVDIYSFDCNIQQIKTYEFDILFYGLFFKDRVEIFKLKKDEVLQLPEYCNKQHRGNENEGQFHLNNDNIARHRRLHLDKILTYEELYELLSV